MARQDSNVKEVKRMVYKWKTASHINADAQVAGEICERLASNNNLTAKSLVAESAPENAPLHKCFEWNNDTAAELYRESQARHIIACLITSKEESSAPVRAFFNLEVKEPTYDHIDVILSVEDKHKKLLENAKKELIAFKVKYKHLNELSAVFAEIDKFTA